MTTEAAARALRQPVRPAVLRALAGRLLMTLAVLTIPPLLVAWGVGDMGLVPCRVAITLGLGSLGVLLGRAPLPQEVRPNEAKVLAAGGFLLGSLVMAVPFAVGGVAPVDAVFEAVSAVTTTGLSTVGSVERLSPGLHFARSWMQWYGGLGMVMLSLAILLHPGTTARRLALTEVEEGDLLGGAREHARRVLVVYTSLTGVGILALLATGAAWLDATCLTLAAVSTGGFATHDASLAALPGVAGPALVLGLSLAGALPLAAWYRAARGEPGALLADRQLPMIVGLGLVTAAVVAAGLAAQGRAEAVLHGLGMAFSAQTTTGFATLDCAQLAPASKLALIFSMLIGGGLGSTSGGLKVLRLMVLGKVAAAALTRTALPPHAVYAPELGGRRLGDEEVSEAAVLLLLGLCTVAASWFVFVAAGYDPLDSLFEVASATGTVGLSVGLAAPALPTFLKAVLCVDMLLGRLEVVAWLVLLRPGTWLGRKEEA